MDKTDLKTQIVKLIENGYV